ncbi:unnamed protein product [Hermetia illucens]|uniref:Uncharacterized protein n=1 Tax=Hermetia illucens TaxID=343691 RepID=A0A7R8YPA9_HERIL|nr:unnamed protein product [Hermetia illucens]
MIEDVPIISINVKILKFWSFILVHNWRRYISIIPAMIMNVAQFLDMYFTTEPIDSIARNFYFVVLWFIAVMRALYLTANRRKFEVFMENLEYMYHEIKRDGEKPIVNLLNEVTNNARRISKFNLAFAAFVSTGFVLYPLFTGDRGNLSYFKYNAPAIVFKGNATVILLDLKLRLEYTSNFHFLYIVS